MYTMWKAFVNLGFEPYHLYILELGRKLDNFGKNMTKDSFSTLL